MSAGPYEVTSSYKHATLEAVLAVLEQKHTFEIKQPIPCSKSIDDLLFLGHRYVTPKQLEHMKLNAASHLAGISGCPCIVSIATTLANTGSKRIVPGPRRRCNVSSHLRSQ
eukprot:4100669-Amphidinium_carterae.1